ncbi:hypothetical protein HPB52_003911 [Rhipicephalus sanguineus]|uniref:PiggyBac transposable element-derived protein domain-containing protein n=1 Tax=Rhipicephalus sanguineus TaxID=34632 RepID=A0A9D4QGY1_RHISA|nr:hypothetical protein HPB52_003911 [Rhipicephalus sanguineus]
MTYKRFQLITNCLHLNDNDFMPDYGTKDYDRSYKVRPLMDMMNERFLANYTASSHLAVDESMILFKGRSSMKQYMPMKPKIKRGYKVWSLADSETGYLLKFQLYEGKSAQKPDDVTLGEHVVLTLTDGAVPAGSQRDLPQVVKENNKLERGSYIWRRKADVVAYQWRDSKNVHLMSNYHDPEDRVQVQRTLQNGKKMAVECPSVVKDYNTWMRGVDKFDQKRNAYPADRRSKRWWSRIFYFMLDAAFRLILGRQLVAQNTFRRSNVTMKAHHNKKGKKKNGRAMTGVPDELRFAGNGHHPKFTGKHAPPVVNTADHVGSQDMLGCKQACLFDSFFGENDGASVFSRSQSNRIRAVSMSGHWVQAPTCDHHELPAKRRLCSASGSPLITVKPTTPRFFGEDLLLHRLVRAIACPAMVKTKEQKRSKRIETTSARRRIR